MTRSAKLSNSSSTSRQPKTAYFIRMFTRRAVCLSLVLVLCCLSLLVSLSQFSFRASITKRETGGKILKIVPQGFYPIRYEREVLWMNNRDPSLRNVNTNKIRNQGQRTYQKKWKNTSHDETENGDLFLSDENANSDAKKPLAAAEENVVLIDENLQQRQVDEKPIDIPSNKVSESANGSYTVLLDNEVGSPGADVKRYKDYGEVMGAEPIADFYSRPDPARMKLIKNVQRFHRRKKQAFYYRQTISKLPEQTKGIVILTNYRSGSTFLGELFNQHPDAFYIFEPLYPFTGDCVHQRQLKVQLVKQLLKCDFPSMTELYKQIKGPMRKNHVDILCLVDDFCFRKNTKELCQRDLCPVGVSKSKYCKNCGPLHLSRAMKVCRQKKLSAIKAIRLCDILDLKPILSNPNMDIKVIHLVRDPRGIQSSRYKIHSNWSMEDNARSTCDRLLHNGVNGLGNSIENSWLKGKYMRVRYEDLSLKPLIMAEKIYKYAGLDFLPEVQSWIKANTRAKSTKSKVNPYATKRDSAVAMQAWRTHLSIKQVLTVQKVCSKMMNFFGYKTVANQKELLNLSEKLLD